ncbi:class I lanthipeptide [Chitinophaga sp. GbtcB8]|uniref:class I lanthipeptide n=1 Tax=Chitinophaga sp. GbtcB8 TaxID=2824753 RepID=UPI001C309513|nr:class I lanthipeptide [Chitinophaga sp. GbtcB8]
MKTTLSNTEKKLLLNKITIIRLDADKLSKIVGGNKSQEDGESTRPECGNTQKTTNHIQIKDNTF